jgi:predicted nucleotidyltransferase
MVALAVRELTSGSTEVLLYGSWVRGTAVPRSDVDLAIVGESGTPPLVMAELRERIDALPTLRKFDVVDIHSVGESMRKRILSEGVAV